MSVVLAGIPQSIANLVQERTLERVFHDALFPRLLFRPEAQPELWVANIGEQYISTRAGLISPNTNPLVPGQDPTPRSYATEQWEVIASQYGETIDTHMPSSYVSIASLFLRNTQTLGLNAAQVLNRLARNKLFREYLAGEASVETAAAAAASTVRVTSLSGFLQTVTAAGRLVSVSPAAPLPVTFSTLGEPANTVTAAIPDDPALPYGPGTLQLGAALVVGVAARSAIYAGNRSRRLRVGGGATIDALTTADILTLNDIISAVSRLREQNVPPHSDGKYHVHLSPQAEAELFRDTHWQRLFTSLPHSYEYRDLAIGEAVGCYFFRNTETPNRNTVESPIPVPGGAGGAVTAPDIGADIVTAGGLDVVRTLITGGGVLYEKYLDESKYISEAGVTGKIGEFSIINGGAQIMTNRIRFILRSPLDRLQQVVSQSWSWSGDFGVPSDLTNGDAARFKRAVVIEHS